MDQKRSSGCLKKLLWGLLGLAVLVILILVALVLNQRVALSKARQQYPAPGALVNVDGHLMHLNCQGSGLPTVVIDAGNGSFSLEWTPIQEELSQSVRVCTYDRAGYGWSEPGPGPRDGLQAASELYALLGSAGETGPYLLVGHSLGGVIVRIFAVEYPEETAGLVLVDAPYPLEVSPELETQMATSVGFYQVIRLLSGSGVMRVLGQFGGGGAMPEIARKLPSELQEPYLNLLLDPAQYNTSIAEMEQLPNTFQEASQMMSGEQPLADLPLIVLTAGQMAGPGSTPFNELLVPVEQSRIDLQAELARTSSQGEQRVLAESGHSVHLDAPEAVIQAVIDIAEVAKSSK